MTKSKFKIDKSHWFSIFGSRSIKLENSLVDKALQKIMLRRNLDFDFLCAYT